MHPSASVVFSHACFSYTGSVPLLADCTLELRPGWTGIVGPNGAGKTTLLRLVLGELRPDAGEVRVHPPGLAVRLCPQTVERKDGDLAAFARAEEGGARRLRARLGLAPEDLARWASLSPGERKRWQVGAALCADPGVLILDEPTNHLDAEARARLLEALHGWTGVGLVVSHDRALLDALTRETVRFRFGEIRAWRGPYSKARLAWEAEERAELDAYQRVRSEKRELRRRLADARRERETKEARMRRALRQAGHADHDTRGRLQAKRRRSAVVSLGREIGKLHGRLDRLEVRERVFELHKDLGRSLFVDFEPAPVARLMHLDQAELRAGARVLLAGVRVQVERASRVHVRGRNGAGKTTLLRALLASARVPPARILFLPQELAPEAEVRLLAGLRAAPGEEQGRVLSILAALGVDPGALLACARPSPGAARKLALAFGLARRVFALVLDEPTNHLDLPSIERLETALAAYPGALVVVTHDDAFARGCTSTVWELADGALRVASGERR
jgi:ATPase subunit of ABC transporter with duplicated ATPase domains